VIGVLLGDGVLDGLPYEPATAGLCCYDRMAAHCVMFLPMAFTVEDRLAIYELLALHGHLMDAGGFDRLGELFTDDFVYDVEALGYGALEGAQALAEASQALGDDNPLGHRVMNARVTGSKDDEATVRSKGIGILANGTSGTVVYEDTVRRTRTGWRIARRTVIPRRRPLHAQSDRAPPSCPAERSSLDMSSRRPALSGVLVGW
jgi:3-phenylpropionate/cinnamic acid dioxygenase small subunit